LKRAEQCEARFKGEEPGFVYSRYANPTNRMFEERLALSRRQLDQAEQCDFLIVNDEVERAAEELSGIVRRALDGAATMPT